MKSIIIFVSICALTGGSPVEKAFLPPPPQPPQIWSSQFDLQPRPPMSVVPAAPWGMRPVGPQMTVPQNFPFQQFFPSGSSLQFFQRPQSMNNPLADLFSQFLQMMNANGGLPLPPPSPTSQPEAPASENPAPEGSAPAPEDPSSTPEARQMRPPMGPPPPPPMGPPPMGSQPVGPHPFGPPPPMGRPPMGPAPPMVPPPTTGGCPPNNPQANKAMVQKMYQEVFANKNVANLNSYVAEDLIEHNPLDEQGREALKNNVLTGVLSGPPVKIDIQRIAADGDLVWVHSRFPITKLNSTFAIVDIFRIKCGLVQEHWDVIQDTNITSNNPAPFFK